MNPPPPEIIENIARKAREEHEWAVHAFTDATKLSAALHENQLTTALALAKAVEDDTAYVRKLAGIVRPRIHEWLALTSRDVHAASADEAEKITGLIRLIEKTEERLDDSLSIVVTATDEVHRTLGGRTQQPEHITQAIDELLLTLRGIESDTSQANERFVQLNKLYTDGQLARARGIAAGTVAAHGHFEGLMDANRFADERTIGAHGGQAIISIARDTTKNRIVALKKYTSIPIYDDQDKDGRASRWLVDRLTLAAVTNHPALMKIYGYFFTQLSPGAKCPVLVIEYFENNKTLDTVLREHTFSQDEIIDFIKRVGPAIQNILDCRRIHRDLSPMNVLCGAKQDQPYVLIDFENLMKEEDEHQTTTLGTVLYAAPEIFMKGAFGELDESKKGHSIPFFALCRIAIHMACGSLQKFKDEFGEIGVDNSQNVERHLTERLPNASLRHILEQGTAQNPNDRYQTWEQMLIDLESSRADGSLTIKGRMRVLMDMHRAAPKFSDQLRVLFGGRVRPRLHTIQIDALPKPAALQSANPQTKELPETTANTPPTPPPLMPMNVVGIRQEKGSPYFEIETDTMLYNLEAEPTDGSKSRTQDDWVTFFNKRGDGTRLPTPGEILRIVVALQQQLAQNKNDPVALELKAKLIEDFKKHWMMTGARIHHSKSEGDKVIRNYRQTESEESDVKKFWGPNEWFAKQNDRDMIAHSLFDAQYDEIESAFKWLMTKDSYVWRITEPYDGERPVVLGLDVNIDRFDISASYVYDSRPARGVAVRKKI